MTPEELVALCDAPVDGLDGGPVIPAHIYLTVRKSGPPPGERVRLAGRSGPLGRVCVASAIDGGFSVVAVFDRPAVRKFAASLVEPVEKTIDVVE